MLILKIALEIGNFLNAGGHQGSAIGFQLETLLKLKDVRSTRNRAVTLLHYLARELQRQRPEDYQLKELIPFSRTAAKLSMPNIREEVKELKMQLGQLLKLLDSGELGSALETDEGMTFKVFLSDFHANASSELEAAEAALSQSERSFQAVAVYLSGSGNKLEVTGLFELLRNFADDLERAHKDNAVIDAKSVMRQSMMRQSVMRPSPKQQSHPAPPQPQGPIHQKDNVMMHIRAYAHLRPEDRRTLLTDHGARERLRANNITTRQSVAVASSGGQQHSHAIMRSSTMVSSASKDSILSSSFASTSLLDSSDTLTSRLVASSRLPPRSRFADSHPQGAGGESENFPTSPRPSSSHLSNTQSSLASAFPTSPRPSSPLGMRKSVRQPSAKALRSSVRSVLASGDFSTKDLMRLSGAGDSFKTMMRASHAYVPGIAAIDESEAVEGEGEGIEESNHGIVPIVEEENASSMDGPL
eukprot:gene13880-19805_t